MNNVRKFLEDHRIFGKFFVFEKRKIDLGLMREVAELRRLIEIYDMYISEDNFKEMVQKPDIKEYKNLTKKIEV